MSRAAGARAFRADGLLYLMGAVAQIAGLFAVMPFVTRSLNATQFGRVALVLVSANFASIIASLGLPASATRAELDRSIGWSSGSLLVSALVLNATAGALVAIVVRSLGEAWIFGVAAGLITTGLGALSACQPLLRVRGHSRASFAIGVASAVGAPLAGLLSVLSGTPNANTYLLGYGVVLAITSGVAIVALDVRTGRWSRAPTLVPALKMGLPTVLNSVSLTVVNMADRFLVAGLAGVSSVGRYQVAYAVGSSAMSASSALLGSWTPYALAGGGSDSDRFTRATTVVARVTLLGSAAVALVSPMILPILAPESFRPGKLVRTTIIVAFASVPYVWSSACASRLIVQGLTTSVGFIGGVAAVANLLGNLLLIPVMGLEGAATATTLSFLLSSVLYVRRARDPKALRAFLGSMIAWASGFIFILALDPMTRDGVELVGRSSMAILLTAYAAKIWLRWAG